MAAPPQGRPPPHTRANHLPPGYFTLFVMNLPYDCSHEDTFCIFQRFEKVIDIYIPYFPNSSRPRGFAFVHFQYEDEGRAAMGVLDGHRIDGRKVQVQIEKLRKNRPPQSNPIPKNPPPLPIPKLLPSQLLHGDPSQPTPKKASGSSAPLPNPRNRGFHFYSG
ncbi:serine/arginine-rich splicing factor SC35-like [Magnolia sinica]|uniref:serine/arginine-rich splicing factor SC35-like n=1 Tax=Magnolia sinica TaxID=86752 RepID=UPI00265A08A0|nr:serine/arginine-rich splicing factor SC35-like [Magnolia sinica]